MAMSADFNVTSHGSVCMLTPLTPRAHTWVDNNLQETRITMGASTAIDARYATDILGAIEDDGMHLAR